MTTASFLCDAILFDLDGVLVDSHECVARIVRQWCERHGLDAGHPRPPILICSEDVIFGKPHPEPYLTAARHLKVSPGGCVVIEDAPPGIESARRAGMRTIGVLSTYGAGAVEGADIIATSLASLNIRPVGGRIDVGVVAR